MKILKMLGAAIAISAVLAGCGGSGGGGGTGNNPGGPLTREQVVDLLENGLKNSNTIVNGQAGGGGEELTRGRVERDKKYTRLTERTPKGVTRDHEGGDNWTFWFDDWTGLWVEQLPGPSEEDPNAPYGYKFFEDHEKTKPAGHELEWFQVTEGENFSYSGKWEVVYLAGNFAGEWHKEEWNQNDDWTGTLTGSGHIPGQGTYEFSGEWTIDWTGVWTEKFTYEDGTWHQYKWTENEDYSGNLEITSSQGITIALNFATDWTGTGSITGNGEGLPATIAWDEFGEGEITWADGTKTPFNVFDFLENQGL